MTRLPRAIIKARAQERIEHVLRALGIAEPVRGNSISIINHLRGETGKNSPSLQIWVKPGFEGAWKDHGAGLQGDVFDLVAWFNGWFDRPNRGFAESADWLARELGLEEGNKPAPDEAARQRAIEAAGRERRIKEQAEKDAINRRAAKAIWLKGEPALPAPYFRARGIDVRKLHRPPGALRLIERHLHRESGKELPCMVAGMQTATDFIAVHRTWLTPDITAKASTIGVKPARKIWPTFTGSFIALARGASGLPVREANAKGIADDLVLVEGIEKGLAVAVADHGPRVWAFGSLANLAHVPIPDCASSIIVCADNDIGNERAQALLDRGLEYLHGFGRPVSVARAPIGKDVDELLKAGEDDDGYG